MKINSNQVSSKEIENYFWPISNNEIISFRDKFIKSTLKKKIPDHLSKEFNLLLVIYGLLISDLMTLFFNNLINERILNKGYSNLDLDQDKFLRIINAEEKKFQKKEKNFFDRYEQQIEDYKNKLFLRKPYRSFKLLFNRFYPNPSPFSRVDFKSDNVSISISSRLQNFINNQELNVKHIDIRDWFLETSNLNKKIYSNKKYNSIIELVIESTSGCFKASNLNFSDFQKDYITSSLEKNLKLIDNYLGGIMFSNNVPLNLLTGTGGSSLIRMIRLASIESGGKVLGFDHSHGQGMFESYSNSILELPFLTQFYVSNNFQKKQLEKEVSEHNFIFNKDVKVCVLEEKENLKFSNFIRKKKKNKKIMLVSSIYNQEVLNFNPLPYPVPMLDWELRVMHYLRKQGHYVIYKPHPESRFKAESIMKKFNFGISLEKFDKSYHKMDLLIFGVANTSAFYEACKSNIPIFVVEIGFRKWSKHAIKFLRKRAGFMTCSNDNDNKVYIDWERFESEFKRSFNLKDKEFASKILYGT